MTDKRVAVVLSGCGVFDGAEIHESVLSLLALQRQGASYLCFAPDIPQHHGINHLTGDEMDESRSVLVEAARIARGDIKPLACKLLHKLPGTWIGNHAGNFACQRRWLTQTTINCQLTQLLIGHRAPEEIRQP